MTGEAARDRVKMLIQLDDGGSEGVWVEPLSDGVYRLDNVPYYAYGLSCEDIVRAQTRDGCLIYEGVAVRGGHSTYRLFLDEEGVALDEVRDQIPKLGCSFEGAWSRLIAIDVPPGADVAALHSWLEQGERAGRWTFEEGHYEGPSASTRCSD